ncbi:MAG: peptidylprolyl isomerase, partial [Marmoricola sp.]
MLTTIALKRCAAIAACLSVLALAGCGNESDGADTAEDPAGDAAGATTSCEYPSDGQEPAREVEAPEAEAPDEGTVTATMTTNFGDIGVTLDAAATP